MLTKNDETEDKNRLQVFLKAERADDGFFETDLEGKRTHLVKHARPETITLENLNTFQSVDPSSGLAKCYISAKTHEEFRAIGAERAYPIFFVTVGSDIPAGTAVIRETYGVKGHAYRGTLDVGLSESALERIVHDTRTAPSVRNLIVQMKGPSFFGTHPDVTGGAHLLSWWADQPQSSRKAGAIDQIEVTWSFEIASVTVAPERPHSLASGERSYEKNLTAAVHVERPIGVYYSREAADQQGLAEHFEKLLKTVDGLRTPLYIIAIAVALIAAKLIL